MFYAIDKTKSLARLATVVFAILIFVIGLALGALIGNDELEILVILGLAVAVVWITGAYLAQSISMADGDASKLPSEEETDASSSVEKS